MARLTQPGQVVLARSRLGRLMDLLSPHRNDVHLVIDDGCLGLPTEHRPQRAQLGAHAMPAPGHHQQHEAGEEQVAHVAGAEDQVALGQSGHQRPLAHERRDRQVQDDGEGENVEERDHGDHEGHTEVGLGAGRNDDVIVLLVSDLCRRPTLMRGLDDLDLATTQPEGESTDVGQGDDGDDQGDDAGQVRLDDALHDGDDQQEDERRQAARQHHGSRRGHLVGIRHVLVNLSTRTDIERIQVNTQIYNIIVFI